MADMRRIYLPLGATDLETLRDTHEIGGPGTDAYAVTRALQAAAPGTDDVEVHEFMACQDAALSAIQEGKQVVLAADVSPSAVEETGTDSRVRLAGAVPMKRVASFHVVDTDSHDEDPGAEIELSWFDVTELDLVLKVLTAL